MTPRRFRRIAQAFVFIFLGITLPSASPLHAERIPEQTSPEQNRSWGELLKKTVTHIEQMAPKRPFKLKALNDSLDKTARAIKVMNTSKDYPAVLALLAAARRDYSENDFALLLEGVVAGSMNQKTLEIKRFEEFLYASKTYTSFDKTFLTFAEFQQLRKTIQNFLTAQGTSFRGKEKAIELRLPMHAFVQYLVNPGPRDALYAGVFLFSIIAGALLLLFAHFWGVDFSRLLPRALILLYLNIWLAYAVWLVDLVAGLPWGLNRFTAIPYSFLFSFFTFLFMEGLLYYREQKRPLPEGYRRCQYCKKIIPQIAVECPECRRFEKILKGK